MGILLPEPFPNLFGSEWFLAKFGKARLEFCQREVANIGKGCTHEV
jgi:hypothetical protein